VQGGRLEWKEGREGGKQEGRKEGRKEGRVNKKFQSILKGIKIKTQHTHISRCS
jgi:flagellar biosynthesis/type III secretory pathway protein FliH